MIAISEITRARNIAKVREYLVWYFDHLNYPDLDGLTGSIYNYQISKAGKETSTKEYDSVDGYAGTFLYLANLYHQASGDHSLIHDNWVKIRDIAYLIPYLQSEDGLIRVSLKARNNVKYLMDNCEAYAGIRAFQELAVRVGYRQEEYYMKVAENIRVAVLSRMYNRDAGNFYWAMDDRGKHATDWGILYPGALAQVFPVCFGLLAADEEMAKMLWHEFNVRHGKSAEKFPVEQRIIYELAREKMLKLR
jgi:hypothetical protein